MRFRYIVLMMAIALGAGACARGSTTTADVTAPRSSSPVRDASLFKPLGASGCAPPSPFFDWFEGDGLESGIAEARATSTALEVWGLLWDTPPLPVGIEIKMVWRVSGFGDFEIRAFKGGEEAELTWGPRAHDGSSFDRPGEEWGTAFVFPSPGCWDIQIVRGGEIAHVWVEASQPAT